MRCKSAFTGALFSIGKCSCGERRAEHTITERLDWERKMMGM